MNLEIKSQVVCPRCQTQNLINPRMVRIVQVNSSPKGYGHSERIEYGPCERCGQDLAQYYSANTMSQFPIKTRWKVEN